MIVTAHIIDAALIIILGGFLLAYRPTWQSVVVYAGLMLGLMAGDLTALGRPVPLWAARPFLPATVEIAGYKLHEGISIDLLIAYPEMLVTTPWDEQRAAQLYHADQQARAAHVPLMMNVDPVQGEAGQGAPGKGKLARGNPGHTPQKGQAAGPQGTKDNEQPLFYPAPLAALPDKQGD